MTDSELVDRVRQDPWYIRIACETLIAEGSIERVDIDGTLAFQARNREHSI